LAASFVSGSEARGGGMRRSIARLRNCNVQPAIFAPMFRAVAVGLAAVVLLDRYLLDGKYVGVVETVARSVTHFVLP
jgi:hypothetical protein